MLTRILPGIVLFSFLAAAQPPAEQPVTNADVAAMLQGGLAESTIVNAIDLAAQRGSTRFDVSPQALVRLKDQGASPAVLEAMLAAARMPEQPMPSTAVAGLPAQEGLYYHSATGMLEIPSIVLWPEVNMSWRGMTAVEERRYVLVGPHAEFRLRDERPTFYVRGPVPNSNWQLVRLRIEEHEREWQTAPSEMPMPSRPMRIAPEFALPLELKPVAWDVLELRPASPLAPGEYALVTTNPAAEWLSTVFPFAVAGPQGQ